MAERRHFQGTVSKVRYGTDEPSPKATILSSYQAEGEAVIGYPALPGEDIEADAEEVVNKFEEDDIKSPDGYVLPNGEETSFVDENGEPQAGADFAAVPYNSKLINHTYKQALQRGSTDYRFYKHGAIKYVKRIVNVGTRWTPWLVVRWDRYMWRPIDPIILTMEFKSKDGKRVAGYYPQYWWEYQGRFSKIPGE